MKAKAYSERREFPAGLQDRQDVLGLLRVGATTASEVRDVLHARAVVLLAPSLPPAPRASPPPPARPSALDPATAYASLLFHGPDFHALAAVESLSAEGAVVRSRPSPPPRDWIVDPIRGAWIADPLALDAAFQAAILWAIEVRGAPALPTGFARYLQYRRAFPGDGVRVALHPRGDREHAARFDAEFSDAAGALVARMEGYECTVDKSLNGAFRKTATAY